jgi:hypothetical protein
VIPRLIQNEIHQRLATGKKAVLLFGARQVGKTTLVREVLKQLPYRALTISADELAPIDILSSRDLGRLSGLVSGYDALFVDEAQRIPEIGLNLKLLIDHKPDLRIIATGSSSLHLASQTREPLTGRAWSYRLYPIATCELAQQQTPYELNRALPQRLVYGNYPELLGIESNAERRIYLGNLVTSYLYKDVLEIANLRYSHRLRDLLRLLAFQIGQEVSLSELGAQLQMSKETVASYIDLLEQSFVVFRVGGFSRNLRKEVSKKPKIFFWDTGVRNVLIDNLNALSARNDVGQLWENFMQAERRKWLDYANQAGSSFFWRTRTGAEIDLVEERDGAIFGYEYKWGNIQARAPQTFLETYAGASFETINQENWLAHVGVR